MDRKIVNGYQKFLSEMLILEPKDWSPAEWETLCKLSGLPFQRTERIVLHLNSIECYISSNENSCDEKSCPEKEVILFPDGSLHLTGYSTRNEEIILPPVVGHDIFEATEMFYAEEDIKQRLNDIEDEKTKFINFEEIHQMAREVVSAKSDNDGISERYWSVVDDVIKNFLSNF